MENDEIKNYLLAKEQQNYDLEKEKQKTFRFFIIAFFITFILCFGIYFIVPVESSNASADGASVAVAGSNVGDINNGK